jgi:exodeoxyribonuclease VII small subunit
MPKAGASASTELQSLSFEQILDKLSQVVEQIEDGELPLEKALTSFEQGVALARAGQKRLDEAERRIEILLQDDSGSGAPQTRSLQEEPDHDE